MSDTSQDIHEGSLIDYSLQIRGVPVRWRTQIENWNPPHLFADRQLKGPYQTWFHTHEFKDLGEGTLMIDRVLYRLPLGALGFVGGAMLVESEVNKIFDYRREQVAKIFN